MLTQIRVFPRTGARRVRDRSTSLPSTVISTNAASIPIDSVLVTYLLELLAQSPGQFWSWYARVQR